MEPSSAPPRRCGPANLPPSGSRRPSLGEELLAGGTTAHQLADDQVGVCARGTRTTPATTERASSSALPPPRPLTVRTVSESRRWRRPEGSSASGEPSTPTSTPVSPRPRAPGAGDHDHRTCGTAHGVSDDPADDEVVQAPSPTGRAPTTRPKGRRRRAASPTAQATAPSVAGPATDAGEHAGRGRRVIDHARLLGTADGAAVTAHAPAPGPPDARRCVLVASVRAGRRVGGRTARLSRAQRPGVVWAWQIRDVWDTTIAGDTREARRWPRRRSSRGSTSRRWSPRWSRTVPDVDIRLDQGPDASGILLHAAAADILVVGSRGRAERPRCSSDP